jgi:energy-coupling factor transporter ATP-binding protein EcfA2
MHDDGFMGRVIVITGPPGSGKSTVSEELALLLSPSALVQGDEFFGFLRAGAMDPWLEGAAEQNQAVIEGAAACVGRLPRRYEGVVGPCFSTELAIRQRRLAFRQQLAAWPPSRRRSRRIT